MKAMKNYNLLAIMFFVVSFNIVNGQDVSIKGTVVQTNNGSPLIHVNVSNIRNQQTARTDRFGKFVLTRVMQGDTLLITHTGFINYLYIVSDLSNRAIRVEMEEATFAIDEIMVATGYQTLSHRTATGSFEKINDEEINRTPTVDILGRLKNNTTALYFNESY